MNVAQLIQELQKHDPAKMVVIRGYESGVDEVNTVEEIRLDLNVNSDWWYGAHQKSDSGECQAIHIGFKREDN